MASLPYPRSQQTIFPQNSRDTQKRLAEKKNLCTSVKSVGGSYLKGHTCYVGAAETAAPPKDLCENLCNPWENILRLKLLCTSVKSVGGSYLPEGSVGSACSVGDSYLKLCWCSGDRCTP